MPITTETISKEARDKLNKIFPCTIGNDRSPMIKIGENFIKSALGASTGGSISRTLLDNQIKIALAKFDTELADYPYYKDSLKDFLTEYSDKIISHSSEINQFDQDQRIREYLKEKEAQSKYNQSLSSVQADRANKVLGYSAISISPVNTANAQSSAKAGREAKPFPQAKQSN